MVTEMQKPLETEINAYEQRRAELERITCEMAGLQRVATRT